MLDSQVLSSFLCIGFLFSAFNGFVITSNQKKMAASNAPCAFQDLARRESQAQSRMDQRYGGHFAVMAKSKSSATAVDSTSSDKVKEMAAFLSIQLLQKVMSESMKPEGESSIDLETIERLTKALQMRSSETSSGELSSEATTTLPGVTEERSKPSDVSTTESNPIGDHNTSTLSENIGTKSNEAVLSTTVDEHGIIAPTDIQTETRKETQVKDKIVTSTSESISSPQQIPEIIRSPLEIIQSNIPPLRPESVPRKKPDDIEDHKQETETYQPATLAIDGEGTAVKSADKTDTIECSKTVVNTSLPMEDILERQKSEESFRRKLLRQRIDYDRNQATQQDSERDSEQESEKDDGDTSISMVTDEETQIISTSASKTDIKAPVTAFPEQAHSNEKAKGEDEKSNEVEPDAPALTDGRFSSLISERSVETIIALRQPKSSDEEIKLAAKYAQMESLEDRAYAVLCDLGMIEEHKDPRDPLYDHSKDDEYCEQRFLPSL